MKTLARIVAVLLPVAGAELVSKWWTEPPSPATESPVLTFHPPADAAWRVHDDLFREVQPSLRCDGGWIADVAEKDGPGLRVACFSWDDTATGNTLEAFRHLPEQCMGSIGMQLEETHPPRSHRVADHTLVFDSTLFRPRGGGMAVHIFKCVWVQDQDHTRLRGGVLEGKSIEQLRQLRLSAAVSRFKPRHTRVIMGAVAGMPSEELAWHRFSATVFGHLTWRQSP